MAGKKLRPVFVSTLCRSVFSVSVNKKRKTRSGPPSQSVAKKEFYTLGTNDEEHGEMGSSKVTKNKLMSATHEPSSKQEQEGLKEKVAAAVTEASAERAMIEELFSDEIAVNPNGVDDFLAKLEELRIYKQKISQPQSQSRLHSRGKGISMSFLPYKINALKG